MTYPDLLGLIPAPVTPFARNGDVDQAAIKVLAVEAVPTTDSKDAASCRLGRRSWWVKLANEWVWELGITTV